MHTALIAAGVMQLRWQVSHGDSQGVVKTLGTRRNSSELATMLLMNAVTEHKPALVVACGST